MWPCMQGERRPLQLHSPNEADTLAAETGGLIDNRSSLTLPGASLCQTPSVDEQCPSTNTIYYTNYKASRSAAPWSIQLSATMSRSTKPAYDSEPTLYAAKVKGETLDLAVDLDLEAQLSDVTQTSFSQNQDTTSCVVPPRLPATLPLDDPENPKSWSTARKFVVDLVLCTWVLSLTFSSTAYVASLPALMQHFHVSQEVALLGVTLTVFGFAAGPIVFGPASEIWGRAPVYRFAGLFYSGFSIASAFAPSAPSLLVFRFLVGFFGAASINNVPASIGDFTHLEERGLYTILYALMAFGGPSLGPLVSAFIQHDVGFRWNLRVMAILSTVLSILVALVPETHGPTIMKRRNKESAKPDVYKILTVFQSVLARPIIYLFTEPLVTIVSIYLSVLYGILYGFFEAFGVVFLEIRGFTPTNYGLTYIALGLGFLAACVLLATVGQTMYLNAARRDVASGVRTQPEARLGLAFYGAVLSPISLFLFAWTAPYVRVHWIVPCIAEFLFALSMLVIFTGFVPFLIDTYQLTAASALAAGMASRALVGSVFPLFSLQMYHALGVQGATSLLGGVACLLAPIPFVFKLYGREMRARSRRAVVVE
ncbi:MFS transporter [Mycena kentingensis (nom. inval.)]|nr:MFS transporter [Mycena kentingensis (nom. inval.)]